jgi:hypothetical protein
MSRLALLACVVLAACAACARSGGPAATGVCVPTRPGGAPAAYADARAAREAFTRRDGDGTLEAVLEDAAWLRHEGTPEQVEQAHRAYFEHGYTSFQVVLRSKEFTQPTAEGFVLEDDRGARVRARPLAYRSRMGLEDGRFVTEFELSFQHALGGARWVRLTRERDGARVEWRFE